VEVSRPKRPSDTCQAELQRMEAELQRCLEERALPSARPGTLAGLSDALAAGVIDEGGLLSLRLGAKEFTQAPGDMLRARTVHLYRSTLRVAVAVELKNHDREKPWMLEGAALLGTPGEVLEALLVRQAAPLAPGESSILWVEMAAPRENSPRTYTLTLWDVGKARTATLHGVRLP
jgi:uncharacterized protein (TIGR02268 family)